MLNQEERIHTKRDLRDWLNYELGKYTGGGYALSQHLNVIFYGSTKSC